MSASIWSPEDTIAGIPAALLNKFVDLFTGNGSTTVFGPLTQDPGVTNNVDVYVSGVHQTGAQSFTLIDGYVVFTEAPPTPDVDNPVPNIVVSYGAVAAATGSYENASQIVYQQAGTGSVPTTVQAALRRQIWVEDFGALGNWDPVTQLGTDDSAAFQRAANYAAFLGAYEVFMQSKCYVVNNLGVSRPVLFVGQMRLDLENTRTTKCPGIGTWLIHTSTTQPQFYAASNEAKNAGFIKTAFFQTGHAEPAPGWAPTVHDWHIRWENTQGTLILDQCHMHNMYLGINFDFSVRPRFNRLTGQWFYRCATFDRMYDVGTIDGVHAWTYWSEDESVLTWTQANGATFDFKRCDGMQIAKLFSFGQGLAVLCTPSPVVSGGARAIQISELYADFTTRAVVAQNDLCELQIGACYQVAQDWPATPVAVQPGAGCCEIAAGSNSTIHFSSVRSQLSDGGAFKITSPGTGNVIVCSIPFCENVDFFGTGAGVAQATAGNLILFGVEPIATKYGGGTPPMFTGLGAVKVAGIGIWSGGAVNGVTLVAGTPGNPAVIRPGGPNVEANTDLLIEGLGTGKVRLGAWTASGDVAANGSVLIKDNAGNLRKVMTTA